MIDQQVSRSRRVFATVLCSLVPAAAFAQDPTGKPATVAEASGFQATSRHADVLDFLEKLRALPHGKRLETKMLGVTVEAREIPLVRVAKPGGDGKAARLRLFVNANIHAGEVEGKEVVLMLLRELAHGQHADLLEHAELFFVPIYNADGNDRINKSNRVSQNGPVRGVGIRPNADGYDLNRDFIKMDTPECRLLMGVLNRYDPHLFMDLHTTNGSRHGYHLTYAPSLATNVDPELAKFCRKTLLPEVRKATEKKHAFRTYDYGNFTRRGERKWATYDHRPRFGTNYYGLRNRIAVLSEAYSYVSFEKRIAATRAFVLETLRACVAHRAEILALCDRADKRLAGPREGLSFGYASRLEDPWEDEVLVGSVSREKVGDLGTRLIAKDEHEAKRMPVQTAFVATKKVSMPVGWLIPDASDAVVFALLDHGLDVLSIAGDFDVDVETFKVSKVGRKPRPFQKHNERWLEGRLELEKQRSIAKGTILVYATNRLGRVAAQLLEAFSEDSLVTWNYFDRELEKGAYPVLRVMADPGFRWKRVASTQLGGRRQRILK